MKSNCDLQRFLEVNDVLHTKISFREIAQKCSNLGYQVYDRLTCAQKSKTWKCKCKAAEHVHQNAMGAVHAISDNKI